MKNKKCFCNSCGKQLNYKKGTLQEDALFIKKEWGYFSNKDLEIHEFAVCESCYDNIVSGFAKNITIR